MRYGNVMLSWHNFKLDIQTVHCLNLLDMSEVATTSVMSVLVISKIPRVHNYNHSVTNRRTLNLMDISVMRYTTHTLSVFGESRAKTRLGSTLFFPHWLGLA